MMPGETAFTRMPRLAYSMASDLVAACRPPLVSEASTDGTPAIGVVDQARGDVDDVPAALRRASAATASCVTWKKPARLIDNGLA